MEEKEEEKCCDAHIARRRKHHNGGQVLWAPKLCATLVAFATSLADCFPSTDLLPAPPMFLTSIPIPTRKSWKCDGKEK
jgi:hypothetical protein